MSLTATMSLSTHLSPDTSQSSSRISTATFGHPESSSLLSPSPKVSFTDERPNTAPAATTPTVTTPASTTIPTVNVSGTPETPRATTKSLPNGTIAAKDGDETAWGSNFWVTLVDPQTQTAFFACPATGQVSWDPPVGNFVLPPNEEGEWWELSDESRGGIPYYYQTKTGETVWERPDGFVIPLGIIQNTALGRRLSQTTFNRFSKKSFRESLSPDTAAAANGPSPSQPLNRRSRSYTFENDSGPQQQPHHRDQPTARTRVPRTPPGRSATSPNGHQPPSPGGPRRVASSGPHHNGGSGMRSWANGNHLPPIPASPYVTDVSRASSPTSPQDHGRSPGTPTSERPPHLHVNVNGMKNGTDRSRASFDPHLSPPPQSLGAAAEKLSSSPIIDRKAASENGHSPNSFHQPRHSVDSNSSASHSPTKDRGKSRKAATSPRRPAADNFRSKAPPVPGLATRGISGPQFNQEATLDMSPVKHRQAGRPIPVQPRVPPIPTPPASIATNQTYPILPHDLASDIQQFVESDYARQYFSTHRTGFLFRRRVPVSEMMTWQKAPLNSPLLTLNRALVKDAVKVFKVIQRIMGDRDRDRPVGVALRKHDGPPSTVASINNGSTISLVSSPIGLLEEERWLLGEGLTHGELRDEIYCQLMKQLSGNPNPESVFRGWQFLSVLLISFPPSKNFETYLHSFMQQRTTHAEGRVDVMAKYCIRRLAYISKKGPRGKPPTLSEIEVASDAAFNPSTFGESLDGIIRLQERNYPHQKVPIILPFLADGILALGGTKSEGIFRVPGDGDSVSELKLRIDRGYYTLDGVDDPHILASLFKLWLRELCDPLIPEEMYNECISAREPVDCVRIVERLPTINRWVVLFVISFLQLFLEERIQTTTKMTPANLALVMAPNLLRCTSSSMAVVFTNASFEQIFVYNLLLHLKCNEVDADYIPSHGLGAVSTGPIPRTSKSRSRRPNH